LPKTHDYTVRGWGWDYTIRKVEEDGRLVRAAGWGEGIRQGDYLILQSKTSGSTRYQVERIEYKQDPRDMWFADLTFAPREMA
jgi:hypothetical protein